MARARRSACGLLALLAGVCASMAASTHAAAADSASTTPSSAVNGWSLHGLSASDLDAQLALMQSDGVTLLRVDASWSTIQPTSGAAYRFGSTDAEVAALATHHIEWLPVIDYSAPWASTTSGDWRSPPADDSRFAAFAAAVAARYGAGGSFWTENPQLPYAPVHTFEIWNEENANYFWDTGPDPAVYARLYLASRSAIHAVDGGARVMVGGLTNPQQGISALSFLARMFQSVPALAGNVDAVGLHPYAANASGVVNFVVGVRTLLDALGESSVPIDVTEFGWQTGNAATEQQRATMMSAVAGVLGNSNCGIGALAPYDWMDPSYITTGDWGLAGTGGVRPAGTAWFHALSSAASSSQSQPCPAVASSSAGSGTTGTTASAGTTTATPITTGATTATMATTWTGTTATVETATGTTGTTHTTASRSTPKATARKRTPKTKHAARKRTTKTKHTAKQRTAKTRAARKPAAKKRTAHSARPRRG
jgi:hypothetical protein